MSVLESLKHAGRFTVNPLYSLFGVSSCGNYSRILLSFNVLRVAEVFEAEAARGDYAGLEIRCEGVVVELFQSC